MKKYFLSLLFVFSILPVSTLATGDGYFSDVGPMHKFGSEIDYVCEQGIMTGGSNDSCRSGAYTEFRPNDIVNRAEFTKIIIESLYSQEEILSCDTEKFSFLDVQSSDWFAKYICLAKKKNIINGYKDGTFQPSNTITLPEAMKIILEGNEIDVMEGYSESYNFGKTICDTCSQLIIDIWSENWASPYIHYFVKNIDEKEEKLEKRIFGAAQEVGEKFFTHKITRGEMAYFIANINNEKKEIFSYKNNGKEIFKFKYYSNVIYENKAYRASIDLIDSVSGKVSIRYAPSIQYANTLYFIKDIPSEEKANEFITNHFYEINKGYNELHNIPASENCTIVDYKHCDGDYLHPTVFKYTPNHGGVLVYWNISDIYSPQKIDLSFSTFEFAE